MQNNSTSTLHLCSIHYTTLVQHVPLCPCTVYTTLHLYSIHNTALVQYTLHWACTLCNTLLQYIQHGTCTVYTTRHLYSIHNTALVQYTSIQYTKYPKYLHPFLPMIASVSVDTFILYDGFIIRFTLWLYC